MISRFRLVGAVAAVATGLTVLAAPASAQTSAPTGLDYIETDFMVVEFTPISDDVRSSFHLDADGEIVSEDTSEEAEETTPTRSRSGSTRRYIPEISLTPRTRAERETTRSSSRSSSSSSSGSSSGSTDRTVILPPEIDSVEDVGSLDYGGSSSASLDDLNVSYSGSIGEKVVQAAMTQVGVPYVWGGTTPGVGVDCSGLIQWAYSEVGVSLPRVSWSQISGGSKVSVNDIKPGDVVGYNGGGHVALYIGDGKVVHAPYSGTVVQVADVRMMPIESVTRWAT